MPTAKTIGITIFLLKSYKTTRTINAEGVFALSAFIFYMGLEQLNAMRMSVAAANSMVVNISANNSRNNLTEIIIFANNIAFFSLCGIIIIQ